jgi:hypothetical protein
MLKEEMAIGIAVDVTVNFKEIEMKGFFFALFLTFAAGEVYAGCPGGVCSLRNRETISNPQVKIVDHTFATSLAPSNEVTVSEPVKITKPVSTKSVTSNRYRCRRCR